jgi:hypothetical protein
MSTSGRHGEGTLGQILAIAALGLSALVLMAGLVIDGGGALVERRESQNTSDFAALAGARVIAHWVDENATGAVVHTNGTDANVQAAINASVSASGATPVTYGAPDGPYYVTEAGAFNGYVGTSPIPGGTAGVTVSTSRTYRPYFLGAIGVSDWKASSNATARGGFAVSGPPGPVFPAGIALAFFETYPFCDGPVGSSPACEPQELTPGNLNVPGGFGWLKFGCDGYGLGQEPPANVGGCQNNRPFLQEEIGPPVNSFGCCTEVGLPGSPDLIGSLPGNKVSADCSYYIDNEITVTMAIWDNAGGTGSNAWYHIVGFAGFQLTECRGGKNISGVWRKLFTTGPTTSTAGHAFTSLSVQLIR